MSAIYEENLQNRNKNPILYMCCLRVGRIDFISPEIEKGNRYDFRTDIYSLGLIMICLMSKQKKE